VKLTTPCEASGCISLESRPDGQLALTTTQGPGVTLVSAAEVRTFATAVQTGFFDELLGGGSD
jgi:hypothetical protein